MVGCAYQHKGKEMALQFVQLNGKARVNSKKYYYGDLTNNVLSGQIGALIPNDCVVLDIDSADTRSFYYVEWIVSKYPNIFITKTTKTGGYHIWFKTKRNLKRAIGLVSIFGWKFDILVGTNNYIVLPDNYEGRKYVNGFKSLVELATGWDSYDVELDNIMDFMPFAQTVNADNILDCKEGGRNDDLISWLGTFCAKGVPVAKIKVFTRVLARITGLDTKEIEQTVLSSLEKYEKRDSSVYETGDADKINIFAGEDYFSTMMKLVDYIIQNKIAGFDEATGTGYFTLGKENIQGMTVKDLKTKLVLYFGDKLYYTQGAGDSKKLARIPVSDRNVLFDELFTRISYNSRHDIYKQLPEWDLTPRINGFLKEYYDCDTNPHLFWLFMTALVGKLKEPEKCYVPYFFDWIGNAGVGKTLLCERLSNGWVEVLSPGRSADDAMVNVYKNNALIALDDECSFFKSVVGKGAGYEWWKQFITNSSDTFSRKFQQPETHPRSFIVVRTSNEPKTSFWIDERRQIIFESKLKKDECKILPLPKEYFAQMLAEAKVYYERNGLYQLTDDDKLSIQMQQAQYFSTENEYYQQAKEYVDWVCTKLQNSKAHSYEDSQCWVKTPLAQYGYAITWMTYAKWCMQRNRKPMLSGLFWNQVGAIARQTGKVIKTTQRIALDGIASAEFASVVYNPDDIRLPEYNTTHEEINLIDEFENSEQNAASIFTANSGMIEELNAVRIKSLETENKLVPMPDIDRWVPRSVVNFFDTTIDKIIPTALTINGMDITYGLGGVHYAKKDWNNNGTPVIYLDVQSMYPTIMVKYNLLSRAVRHPNTFKYWIDERLKAKAEGNKQLADELKLKINSVYGNMKNPRSLLYDPSYGSSIAVLGQKVMTILVMGLKSKGCDIINLNTDGVMFTYNEADPLEVNSFVKKWESVFGLTLTQKTYTEFQQADVNNYRAVDTDGNVITKGKKFKPDA